MWWWLLQAFLYCKCSKAMHPGWNPSMLDASFIIRAAYVMVVLPDHLFHVERDRERQTETDMYTWTTTRRLYLLFWRWPKVYHYMVRNTSHLAATRRQAVSKSRSVICDCTVGVSRYSICLHCWFFDGVDVRCVMMTGQKTKSATPYQCHSYQWNSQEVCSKSMAIQY